ncbi:MAG: two-component regulator propeller domain-containing protein [Bryobacteraceae bacterium]
MWSCLQPGALVYPFALLWTLIFPSAALALLPQDKLSQYGRQTWRTENGLPQNTVRAILQDHEGYIWFGTEGGLVRFDGLKFVVFDAENTRALRSNSITGLLEDKTGTLWIGTTEGITRLHNAEFQTYTTEDGLPANHIWSLHLDRAGVIWVTTPEGTAHFDRNYFIRGTAPSQALIVQDKSGRSWTGSEHGLTFSGQAFAKTYTTEDGLPSKRITTLYPDREGSLWVGTDAGAARIIDNTVERFPAGDPLSQNAVLSIYEDRESNMWFGTDSSGLTILRNQSFTTYTSREGSLDNQIRCVLQTRNGTIWIGTNGGGLRQFKDQQFSTLTTANGLASNIILSLAEDAAGALLIGTPDGLNRLRNGTLSLTTSADGLAEDFIRSVYADTSGSLWVGTRRGLSQIINNHITTYTQANGLGSDLIGAIIQGRDNDLWIGTLHGLTRFRNGTFTNYTTKDGLSSSVITDLYMDTEGTLWIGTQGGGLDRLHDGSFTTFTPQLGMPETIYGVNEDAHGNLWLAAKNGIFRVNKNDLNRRSTNKITVVPYGTSDGLQVSECLGGGHPAIWKDQSGALWFSTAKGVAVLRSGRNRLNQLPPPVALETVYVDDRALDPAQLTEVAPGHSRLSFEYAGLSFIAPQKMQFRYKLEGFDRDWINAGARRTAYYTNIPPGHYRFRVLASNNDGLWNQQGASFALDVHPRFYQTWWFTFLLLLAAALLVYAMYYWRVKQVQSQFNAVLQERNRIAREIHDTLAQGFVGVSVQLEIVSRLLGSSVEAAREHLDQARTQVRQSLSDARRSIWELRSQSPEHQDFASRLSNAAKQTAAASSAVVQLQVHGIYRPLATDVEDELFRIAQEAVTNAVRHSGAKHINIDLAFDTKKLRVTIGDDGCGFNNGQAHWSGPSGHFGLKGMRERAQQIRAELVVNSEIGKGTKVCVEVPAK